MPDDDRLTRARKLAASALGVDPERVRLSVAEPQGRPRRLTDAEVAAALEASGGNRRAAARGLGVPEATLRGYLKPRAARTSKKST